MSALDPDWRRLAVTPIAGADPFGTDPQDDPSFEAVETQIDKLQTDPAALDWERVVEGAVRVLETRAKDWRMACRLTVALYQTRGYPGLALGLGVLSDLLDESRWPRIFPPERRAKMRGAYLEWLTERLVIAVERAEEPPAAAAPALTEAVASLAVIDTRIGAALGDFAPILTRLRTSLERVHTAAVTREAEQAAPSAIARPQDSAPGSSSPNAPVIDRAAADAHPPPAAAGAAVEPAAAVAAIPAAPAVSTPAAPIPQLAPISLGGEPAKALREIKNGLLAVATAWREQRLADPRPYIMLRSALWMDLERLPPHQDGVTQIPEPALERRRLFEQLQQQGDWGRLIAEVEKTLGAGSFYWLDAQRLVANALEALGPNYGEARVAVVQSLALLLRRFPGLERLKFMQGSGFADGLTLTWIGAEVVPVATPNAAVAVDEAATPWADASAAAAALAAKGHAQEGLALFREGVQQAGSLRDRFCWELAQSRACVALGLHAVAQVQLEHLEALVEQFQLEQWEPGLALQVAQLYVTAYTTAAPGHPGQDHPDLHRRMLARLCRFDVAAALTLNAH